MCRCVIERERDRETEGWGGEEELSHGDLQLPTPAPSSWGPLSLRPAPISLAVSPAGSRGSLGCTTPGSVPLLAPPMGWRLCSGSDLDLQPCLDNPSVLLGVGPCFAHCGLSAADLAFAGC